jgi:hypothetical protein
VRRVSRRPADFWAFPVRSVHYALSRLLMVLIALHLVGALYHTFILKDGLLRRMTVGTTRPFALESQSWLYAGSDRGGERAAHTHPDNAAQ